MPSRGEIDPTSIVSVCYAILFGLMLSDAGYGLLMAAACFILVRKYPKMPSGMRKFLKMFGISGIATILYPDCFRRFLVAGGRTRKLANGIDGELDDWRTRSARKCTGSCQDDSRADTSRQRARFVQAHSMHAGLAAKRHHRYANLRL